MSVFLNTAFSKEMVQGLQDTIALSTIETIDQIFGYKLSFNKESDTSYNSDAIIANVEFWENFDTFHVCFIFEKELIFSLVGSMYDDQKPDQDAINEICKDAVCELANIISNKIKLFINKHGFNSVMEIPSAEIISDIDTAALPHKVKVSLCPLQADKLKNVIYVGLKDMA